MPVSFLLNQILRICVTTGVNEQTAATLQWLQQYFYGRSSVSISRSSMYSMYATFCQQNNYRPLIRIQFPFVTSKRLGARGQSKYHYYGIALKDNSQLTSNSDCDYDKPVTRFSRNARLLNPNDYHAILHSMVSVTESPQSSPLEDEKLVFINIYKIHCQCILDSALSQNYSQMRHYVIHFWHQLPNHVQIDLEVLKSLDLNLYSTLEDIYLRLDASLDQLRHLYAIASLNPLWLRKALENYSNKSVSRLKLDESLKWKYRVKSKFQFIHIAKSLDLTQIHCSVNALRELNYEDLYLINDNIMESFISKSPTLDNIIESIDDMIKKYGKLFSKELVMQLSQTHSYALKLLTQMQSQRFVRCAAKSFKKGKLLNSRKTPF
ncbi:unnamed protein product, partial [Medioppia subpectinata]